VSPRVAQKVTRLKAIVAERATWAEPLAQLKRMQHWVVEVEHILDGTCVPANESVSNAMVGQRLDAWREQMSCQLTDGRLSELEQTCLTQLLQVLSNLRPHLVQCYDREAFPRTNNEMERSIRQLKTRYRRISGRKNWNSYILRYGRSVAYFDWWQQDAARQAQLIEQTAHLDRVQWRQMRHEASVAQSEQLKRFRFRHKRGQYLASLEDRWAHAVPTHPLP
jgi:hypothetical protein